MIRRLLFLCLFGAAALSGCVQESAVPVSQGGAVSWGNTGSIFGGGTTTVWPDDRVVVVSIDGTGGYAERTRQGPAGLFDQVDLIARQQLARLPQAGDVGCLDAGTTFVERRDRSGAVQRAESQCPSSEFDAAFVALTDVLAPLWGEAEE